jgi:hypothetical protein
VIGQKEVLQMQNNNLSSIGLGIIVIAIIGLIILGLFYEIGQAPWQFITILIALVGTLITFAGNYQIQIRNEQKPKKVEIYEKVIKFFFDSIFAKKLGQEIKNDDELTQWFTDMTPDLILWSSDEVLRIYIKFRQLANKNMGDSSGNFILLFGEMLLAMRKDLGHQNNEIDKLSILGTFVSDIENISNESSKQLSLIQRFIQWFL